MPSGWRLDRRVPLRPAPPPGRDVRRVALFGTNGDLSLRLAPYRSSQSPCMVPLQARLLPDLRYRNAEEFLAAMARAEVTVLECRASRD